MPLTDTAIRSLTPRERPYKLFDGRGLYLLVQPNGGRWWRLKYRVGGKEKSLSLGTYPDVSLKRVRQHREEARALVAEGIDPSAVRKAEQQQGQTLEAVAREWFSKRSPSWARSHSGAVIRRLEKWVFPWLGTRPIGKVTAAELLVMLRRIEARGRLETAHRVRGYCSQILRYAIATQRAERDVAAEMCVLRLNLKMPMSIDDMTDQVDQAYRAMPDKLLVVDAQGKITYCSKQGPMGFLPDQWEVGIKGTINRYDQPDRIPTPA